MEEQDQHRGRAKPRLNCKRCVRRKTKCDRLRPSCMSCKRRGATCHYVRHIKAPAATISPNIEPDRAYGIGSTSSESVLQTDNDPPIADCLPSRPERVVSDFNREEQHTQAKDMPHEFSFFGKSWNHPFQNYWTCSGGLNEVVGFIPAKDVADSLVQRYFRCVDPLYPIIVEAEFTTDYKKFWNLPTDERCNWDATQLALQFAIFAAATQYIDTVDYEDRVNTTDLYLSACHQSLCLSSYLNRCSLVTIQVMVLIIYVLIGNGRTSDAWTFSGIIQRQAYAMELHRPRDTPEAKSDQRQEQLRNRLWQAVMFQDTNLSMYLELPPSTFFHDLEPICLKRLGEIESNLGDDSSGMGAIPSTMQSISKPSDNDIYYLRSMWEFASFVQKKFCVPRCLRQPLCTDSETKHKLISSFSQMFHNWTAPFNSSDCHRFESSDNRLVRQLIAVSSNYYYVLTMLHMYEDETADVHCDVFGAISASHEGLASFFALARICPGQVNSWGAYNTRAFAQAKMLGKALASQPRATGGPRDARLRLGKSDFDHYLDILTRVRGGASFEETRVQRLEGLHKLRDSITAA